MLNLTRCCFLTLFLSLEHPLPPEAHFAQQYVRPAASGPSPPDSTDPRTDGPSAGSGSEGDVDRASGEHYRCRLNHQLMLFSLCIFFSFLCLCSPLQILTLRYATYASDLEARKHAGSDWVQVQECLAPRTIADLDSHLKILNTNKDPYIVQLKDAFRDQQAHKATSAQSNGAQTSQSGTFQYFTAGVTLREQQRKASGQADPFTALCKHRDVPEPPPGLYFLFLSLSL
jgi:hypothetical protein